MGPRIFQDAVKSPPRQIQSRDSEFVRVPHVANGESHHDAKRLRIPLESVRYAIRANKSVKFILGYMSERRMAEIVRKTCCFSGIRI